MINQINNIERNPARPSNKDKHPLAQEDSKQKYDKAQLDVLNDDVLRLLNPLLNNINIILRTI
jgi:hypothetical protein